MKIFMWSGPVIFQQPYYAHLVIETIQSYMMNHFIHILFKRNWSQSSNER